MFDEIILSTSSLSAMDDELGASATFSEAETNSQSDLPLLFSFSEGNYVIFALSCTCLSENIIAFMIETRADTRLSSWKAHLSQ